MSAPVEETIIYPARIVHTMDPARPVAEAIAVRGDRIRAVGSTAELLAYPGPVRLDDRYADKVLLPGLVEAHAHSGGGALWASSYVGFLDRTAPDGTLHQGCRTLSQVLARLALAENQLPAGEVLTGWGIDPIFFPGEELTAAELDQVSSQRPIKLTHASGHAVVVNSAALSRCGIDADTTVVGVEKDDQGRPTGVLREMAAMSLVAELGEDLLDALSETSLGRFAQDAVNNGVTTITDLGTLALTTDAGVDTYRRIVGPDFPVRLSVFHWGVGVGPERSDHQAMAARIAELRTESTPRLRFGNVKMMADGSIQGFTARLNPPGYYGDQPNGIWATTPEQYRAAFLAHHRAGALIHTHCNGDQTSELFLDTLESVLAEVPRWDHRHTMTHSQMTTAAQYRRLAALGGCANIFSNHIWAWGDQHHDLTLGPDRATRMNAAATALRWGVPISFHSDSPITPLGPLRSAKHAITRLTQSGRVLGEFERIPREAALAAITLGGAWMLKMDHEIGSLEAGKYADVAVLDEDPFTVAVETIDQIPVAGTMVGGLHYAAGGR